MKESLALLIIVVTALPRRVTSATTVMFFTLRNACLVALFGEMPLLRFVIINREFWLCSHLLIFSTLQYTTQPRICHLYSELDVRSLGYFMEKTHNLRTVATTKQKPQHFFPDENENADNEDNIDLMDDAAVDLALQREVEQQKEEEAEYL